MKKEAHVLRFNIYLNEDIAFDEKTVYLSSEQEGYFYNRTKNELRKDSKYDAVG